MGIGIIFVIKMFKIHCILEHKTLEPVKNMLKKQSVICIFN